MPALCTITLPSTSAFAEDDVVHQLVWTGVSDETSTTQVNDLELEIVDWYRTAPSGSSLSLGEYLSPVLSRTDPCFIRFYNIEDLTGVGDMGSPFSVATFLLPVGGGSALPSEVAAALQFEGVGRATAAVETGSTRPKQRHTGRTRLGPLSTSVISTDGGKARIGSSFRTSVVNGAIALHGAAKAINTAFGLAQWSRADAVVREIEAISMDNAFDIIDKRGEKPDAKTRVVL